MMMNRRSDRNPYRDGTQDVPPQDTVQGAYHHDTVQAARHHDTGGDHVVFFNSLTERQMVGLALLRKPFSPELISKLPKPTKAQTDAVRQDYRKGIRCNICGAWHHPDVVHLDYVGHAALTDRLLEADLGWNWEPVSVDESGAPQLDEHGGMWIRLTVCGVTRLGYGHADKKSGGDAIKEVIGDALRNAAMRFGAALALWHKGELPDHGDDAQDGEEHRDVREEKVVLAHALALRLHKRDAADLELLCDQFAIDMPSRDVLGRLADDILDEFIEACRKTIQQQNEE